MKASLVVAPMKSEVQDIALPQLSSTDVLVRVEACGVCASELHRWRGESADSHPFRLGHEPSGMIERVGTGVHGFEVGQCVAALAPGKGAYAQFIAVPQDQIVLIPEGMTFSAAAMAEPLGCLVSGLQRISLHSSDKVAIIGCGFMGLALLHLVKHQGVAEIIAVDVRKEARENALRIGADCAVAPESVEAKDKVVQWSQIGQGVDLVFETTGVQPALTLAEEMVKVHGTLSIVGWHWDGLRSVNVGLWNWKAITVINAHERRMDFLVRYMRVGLSLIERGALQMEELISHSYPLAEVDAAFQAMTDKTPGFIKAVILPQT